MKEQQIMITKELDLTLIDPPEYAVRSNINDAELMELADDIKRVGLIHPVTVKPKGDRYEIVAGHRRYLAHQLLSAKTIRAQIITDTATDSDTVMLLENYSRSEVDPLDEALFFQRLLESQSLSQSQLSLKIGRSASYIGQRLQLIRLPEKLLEALAAGRLTAAQALALAKCPNPDYLQYYQTQAEEQGANARTIQAWLAGCPLPAAGDVNASDNPTVLLTSPAPPAVPSWVCGICGERKPAQECLMVPVCLPCHQQIKA